MKLKDHLKQAEKVYVCDMLTVKKGCVAAAARASGVSRVQFHRLILRHDITPDDFRPGKEQLYPVPEMLQRLKHVAGQAGARRAERRA